MCGEDLPGCWAESGRGCGGLLAVLPVRKDGGGCEEGEEGSGVRSEERQGSWLLLSASGMWCPTGEVWRAGR